MANIRVFDLPALKDWIERLMITPFSIRLLSRKLRSWFGVPNVAGAVGANRSPLVPGAQIHLAGRRRERE
jgi:hypothetical protein